MLERIRNQATWLLARANLRSHTLLQQAFSEAGSKPYFYRLLAALEEHGAASQADLGRKTGIDRSDVVAALNILVERSFAVREADPVDGRRNIVRLTNQGRAELKRLDKVLASVQVQVLTPLSEEERVALMRLLEKLA